MVHSAQTNQPKDERFTIRATSRQRRLLEQAAEASGKTLTAFLLDASSVEAQRTLAERRLFSLEAEQWRRFDEALDRKAIEKPRLRELLEEPGVLD